jgi:hypothetical protein
VCVKSLLHCGLALNSLLFKQDVLLPAARFFFYIAFLLQLLQKQQGPMAMAAWEEEQQRLMEIEATKAEQEQLEAEERAQAEQAMSSPCISSPIFGLLHVE